MNNLPIKREQGEATRDQASQSSALTCACVGNAGSLHYYNGMQGRPRQQIANSLIDTRNHQAMHDYLRYGSLCHRIVILSNES
jgi:hypothetical protein